MWNKLKHEWKTFAVSVGGLLISLHEAAVEAGADWSPLVPEKYRPYVMPVTLTLILTLRRYRDRDVDHK